MITLNVQLGVNPLINHKPRQAHRHPNTPFTYTIGERRNCGLAQQHPRPSLNAEADKLVAITTVLIRDIEQVKQTRKIATLHNDNRLRLWTADDGTCINATRPGSFPEAIVAIVAPLGECRFVIVLAEEAFYIVDCWLLKILTKVVPKKEAYARFKTGSINDKNELQISDGNNRAYKYPLEGLLKQHFLDFGNTINDFGKSEKEIQSACAVIAAIEVQSYYRKSEPLPQEDLSQFQTVIASMKNENLAQVIFCPDLLKDYPTLLQIFAQEQPSISTLQFIGGVHLFLFVGTNKGTVFAVPVSTRLGEPFVLIRDQRRKASQKSLSSSQNPNCTRKESPLPTTSRQKTGFPMCNNLSMRQKMTRIMPRPQRQTQPRWCSIIAY